MSEPTGRARLSMNQATIPRWSVAEAVEGTARAGYGGIGLWRGRVAEHGSADAARRARAAGIEVSSLCRGGFFPAPDVESSRARAEDNRRAVEEAAELGAKVLVLVCGAAAGRDLRDARAQVADGLAQMAAWAEDRGVRLGIEPMHPAYCADRSVVVTLEQALSLAASVQAGGVGVVLDSYHLWWDPRLAQDVAAAAGLIRGVQLADWLSPPPHHLNGRGMLGDGTIDLGGFLSLVDRAGYRGTIEVEIFNPEIWSLDPAETLELTASRFLGLVEPDGGTSGPRR